MQQRNGYVYILTNESMPGLVKIGRSIHGGRSRAKDIYQTGVPTPFKLAFEVYSEDCIEDEINIHYCLGYCRVSDSREFFRMSVDEAVQAVLRVSAGNYFDVSEQLDSEHERLAADSAVSAAYELYCQLGDRVPDDPGRRLVLDVSLIIAHIPPDQLLTMYEDLKEWQRLRGEAHKAGKQRPEKLEFRAFNRKPDLKIVGTKQ